MGFGIFSEITLLNNKQIQGEKAIDIIKKIGTKCLITDFAILLGGVSVENENQIRERTGRWSISNSDGDGDISCVSENGKIHWCYADDRFCSARPVLLYTDLDLFKNAIMTNEQGILELEYGEYPQYLAGANICEELDKNLKMGILKETGKTYTTDSRRWNDPEQDFLPMTHKEYVYKGKKYVNAIMKDYGINHILSDGTKANPKKNNWIEVLPITWYVDQQNKMLISKKLLVSGIRFCKAKEYQGEFKKTEMYYYLSNFFAKDIIPREINLSTIDLEEYQKERKRIEKWTNPYELKFEYSSEEEIIKAAIESDVPVYLHGESSEGKSSRVRQIDHDCKVIHLCGASIDRINGKCVYDGKGKMIELPPSWYLELKEKCEAEPNKLHILFFDELSNALPSIQSAIFDLVLEREVNDRWKLPNNVRIVAAGNEMNESLSANLLAKPLFNRFAHVYIKTTTDEWLKWASNNNIHPAIYSFIAYKKGETLRSKYDGIKPNADPRKWEMASKMLYAKENPEVIRSLVGEDITKEFVAFCKQRIITLKDVINDNYNINDARNMNVAEKHATIIELSQVNEEHLDKVREFVMELGIEFCTLFDSMWSHNDDTRINKILETRLKYEQGIKVKKLK